MSPVTPVVEARGLRFRYPGGAEIGPLDLGVHPGEVLLLTGATGSGKSTLLRVLAGLLGRGGLGEREGQVRVAGGDPSFARPAERARGIGWVGQEPDDQICTGAVGEEVAFPLVSAGAAAGEIPGKVGAALSAVGLDLPLDRGTASLSGGQKQRLALAASFAAGARCLLLDEPTSQLDPEGARAVLHSVRRLADELGAAVVLAEHRLEEALWIADTVAVADDGRIAWLGTAAALAEDPRPLSDRGLEVPGLVRLFESLGRPERPRTAEEAAALLGPGGARGGGAEGKVPRATPAGPACLSLEGVALGWPNGPAILDGLDVGVRPGERVAVLGANGSGKSTLLRALGGELRPRVGRRICPIDRGVAGTRGVVRVPQNPDLALFSATVAQEVAYGPRARGVRGARLEARLAELISAFGLDGLAGRPPQGLSRGQRLRVAVAAAAACDPGVLLLDEPTSGQDRRHVDAVMEALTRVVPAAAVVFATHDVRLAVRHADRAWVLEGGRLSMDGETGSVVDAAARRPGTSLRLPEDVRLAAILSEPEAALVES